MSPGVGPADLAALEDEAGGNRRGAGVAASAFAILVAVWRVAKLAKYPGAEDGAESGKTAQDLGVRVVLEGICELTLELVDLARQPLRVDRAGRSVPVAPAPSAPQLPLLLAARAFAISFDAPAYGVLLSAPVIKDAIHERALEKLDDPLRPTAISHA